MSNPPRVNQLDRQIDLCPTCEAKLCAFLDGVFSPNRKLCVLGPNHAGPCKFEDKEPYHPTFENGNLVIKEETKDPESKKEQEDNEKPLIPQYVTCGAPGPDDFPGSDY
jgi:hypothetical protein